MDTIRVVLYIVVVIVTTVECTDERRLLLHSGDDVIQEVTLLRQEVELLKAQLTDRGSTYTRWGKTTCSGNNTEKVYSGFTAGSAYDRYGGEASFMCLPDQPTWAKYKDGQQGYGGYIYGTEYETTFQPFPQNMQDQDAPCVVCRTPRPTTLMIPGRTDCYPGWELEYTGYLMGGSHSHHATTDYACVDNDPEAVFHGEADQNGRLFYFIEVACGSLPCQEYPSGRELACVVCSK